MGISVGVPWEVMRYLGVCFCLIRLLCLKDYAGATRVISAFPTCSSDLLSFPAHQPMIFRTSKNNSPCSTS